MPLNKPIGYSGIELPYQDKLNIVESLCKGCHYFIFDDSGDNLECGCIYPDDIRGFNPFIRPPYLTVVEIAMNTCDFWRVPPPEQETQDILQSDWNDVSTTPSQLMSKVDINQFLIKSELPILVYMKDIWQLPLMEHSEPLILYGKDDAKNY